MSGWDWSLDGWIVLTGVLSACSCALIGNYLVLRKLSLMGDAISHAVLPGLALAFLLSGTRSGWPMFVGAVMVGALTALLTQLIIQFGKVERGAAMGVVFSIFFAIGLILIRRAADHVDLDPGCVLYGNIVQVPLDAIGEGFPRVTMTLAVVLALNFAFVLLLYKELKIATFDPELANTLGIRATWVHYALMVMVAVTTVANFEAVGSILVIAMLIVPGVTAHLLTDRLGMMHVISLLVAIACAVLGHVLAAFGPGWLGYPVTVQTAASMAVVAGFLLTMTILASPRHGLIVTAYHRRRLARRIVQEDILGLLYRWEELSPDGPPLSRDDLLIAVGNSRLSRGALSRLKRHGRLSAPSPTWGGGGFQLTTLGRTEASKLVGAHRLWETYLAKHFHLDADHVHDSAERVEHYLGAEIQSALRADLTQPEKDPQGKPIPGS